MVQCQRCTNQYLTEGCMTAHLLKDHEPFRCEVCGLCFIWPSAHAAHVSAHRVCRTPEGFRVDLPQGMEAGSQEAMLYLLDSAAELAGLVRSEPHILSVGFLNGAPAVLIAIRSSK